MTTCALDLKELIRGNIQNEINKAGLGVVEGQTYDSDPLLVEGLDKISLKSGARLYSVTGAGTQIRISFQIPDSLVESYQRTEKGTPGRTPYQKQASLFSIFDTVDSEKVELALDTAVTNKQSKLNELAEKTMFAAKQSILQMKKRGLSTEEAEVLSEVVAELQSDPNAKKKIQTITRYLAEASVFMADNLQTAKSLKQNLDPDNVEPTFFILSDVMEGASVYSGLLRDFAEFTAGDQENPLKTLVDKAYKDFQELSNVYGEVAKANSLDKLDDTVSNTYEKAKAAHEEEVRRLEATRPGLSQAQRLRLDKKIARLKEDFNRLSPSKERLEDHLVGRAADASETSKFLQSGIDNADLLVAGFTKIIKDKMQEAARLARGKYNLIGAKYKELLSRGFNDGNIDQAFGLLHVDIKHHRYDPVKDEIQTYFVKYFDSEVSHEWRSEYSNLKALMSQTSSKLRAERASPTPNQSVITNLESKMAEQAKELLNWRRENFEGEYDDRYQAIQEQLNENFLINGTLVNLAELKEVHFKKLTDVRNRIDVLQNGVPTESDIAEINQARDEYEDLKNPETKIPGTAEHLMALTLQKYHEDMKEVTEKFEITPSALERFNRQKSKIDKLFEDGQITAEARDRWYTANTTITYDPRYWVKRKAIITQLDAIAEALASLTGNSRELNLKDHYLELEKISKKYRNHNSHIDGDRLTPEEVEATRILEEEIEALKQEGRQAYSGFLGADFDSEVKALRAEQSNWVEEIHELKRMDPANTVFTKEATKNMREIIRQLKEKERSLAKTTLEAQGKTEREIETFQALYKEYEKTIRELSDLTTSINTEQYYEAYSREMNRFIDSLTDRQRANALKRPSVTIEGKKYKRQADGTYIKVFKGTTDPSDVRDGAEILNYLLEEDFQDTQWYLDNHFEALRWDSDSQSMEPKMIPIYSWRISRPTNKNLIKDEAPNISWKRRKIKEEYRNPNGGLEADGYPKVKQGRWANPEYERKKRENPALFDFRDFMIQEYLSAQENFEQGDRMGLRVPSIERDLSLYNAVNTDPRLSGRQAFNKVKRALTLNEQDLDEGYRSTDESGFEKRVVPILFRGRIEAELVSQNIVETIGKYVGQAEVYKVRRDLSRTAKGVETTLEHDSHAPNSVKLSKIAKFFGLERQLKKRGLNQRLDTVRNVTNMLIYGETVSHESETNQRLYKIISSLLGSRAMALFAGSTWAQLVNLFGGQIQQIIKTAISTGSAKFSFSDFLWAQKQYVKNSAGFVQDVGKLSHTSFWTQFSEIFDINDLQLIGNFGEQLYKKGLFKQIRFDNLAMAKNVVEHELFMTTLMAFSRNYHVTDINGNRIALKDAYEMVGGILTLKPTVNLDERQLSDIKGYINNLMRDINGNYAKLDRVQAENYWFGKTLLFLKKWVIPQVMHRYGGKKFSLEQDRIIEGYYMTTLNYYKDAFMNRDWRLMQTLLYTRADNLLTEQERNAINRTKAEMLVLTFVTLVIKKALGYDDDDKDRFKELEKEHWAVQGLTYALVKAHSEQSVFFPFSGIKEARKVKENLLANTFPYLESTIDILAKDFDWDRIDTNEPYFLSKEPFLVRYKRKTGIHEKGDFRLASDLLKLLGKTNAKASPVEALRSFEQNLNK